jgi:hypothetical protein
LAESVGGQLPADRSAVIAFTSPNDGDGTSRLLISLAPELARRRPGGLLVADGDFHRAGLTKRLSISRPQLGGMSSPVVYATNVAGLSVLPIPTAIRADAIAGQAEDLLNRCAGANQMFALESIPGLPNTAPWVDSGSGNVGEIVTHQRSTGGCRAKHRGPAVRIDPSWIDRLREDWPLVLLDVVSLEHADAWPTLEQCDAAYLVVCIGRTKRPAVRRAVSTFRSRGIRLLGCVALIPVGPDAEQ